MKPVVRPLLLFAAGVLAPFLGSAPVAAASPGSIPSAFSLRLGTQTFAPRYHFTTNTALVETAEAIRDLGSDVIKFNLGRGHQRQYGVPLPPHVTNLTTLARDEPSCRHVLDLPFRHFVLWTYCLTATSDAWWLDGFSPAEQAAEYTELRGLADHLLTTYKGSGKSFYLGHWEGDWHLLPNYNTATNPSSTAIRGMADWLNTRQRAVDDAMRLTPHTNVAVYAYAEVNRVRDALRNGPANNLRLVNAVLPLVTNLDFVSWSAYDGQDLAPAELHAALDFIQAHLSPAKSAVIPGRRVFIGEYGWGGGRSPADQEAPTRAFLRRVLPWAPRFVLFWEMYDNEGKAFALIDKEGQKTPCHRLHRSFLTAARAAVTRFREQHGRLPDDAEYTTLALPFLDAPAAAEPTSRTSSRP